MMTWATVATLVGVWLAGHTVIGVVRPRRARSGLERHATAVLVGAALAVVVTMHAVIVAGPIPPVAGRVLLAAIALPGILFAFRRGPGVPAPPPDRPGALGFLGVGLLLAFAAFAAFYAATMPMHIFDPVYHFAYKAKLIYHEGFGTEAWTDVEGLVGRIITHPDYAPGSAVLNALVGYVGGRFDEDAFRALCSIFALVPAAWLWTALRPRGFAAAFSGAFLWLGLPILYYTKLPNNESWAGSAWAFLFGAPAARERFAPLTFGPADGQILDGGTDLVLAGFLFGAFVHLARLLPASRAESDRVDVAAAGLLLGAAMLSKNEGLALAGVLALAFVLALVAGRLAGVRSAPRVRPLPGLGAALLVAFLATTGWLAIRGDIPSIDENYPERLTPANIAASSHRWLGDGDEPGVLRGYWNTFSHVLRWNLVWPLFFATVLWSALSPRNFARHPGLFAVLCSGGAALLYALILVVTPWHLGVLFGTVIPGRLLVHVTPVVILATVSLLWRLDAEVEPERDAVARPATGPVLGPEAG
jgi:hypothetical protein